MRVYILTLFPEMFSSVLGTSILNRAREQGFVTVNLVDIRRFAHDAHKTVDDYPYGGGPGMVMKPEPVYEAVEWVKQKVEREPFVVLLSPQGQKFDASLAKQISVKQDVVLVAGHYEGFDERIRCLAHLEVSIGDYVLTGGELAAMVVLDASARFIPGVLGDQESASQDSFSHGLLEGPQYTRPYEYGGLKVPEILLSGHHEAILTWRRKESIRRTLKRRPELLMRACLTYEDRCFLEEIIDEEQSRKTV
ncbi:MAG: tRNA (guanosine(37)-N1)-methyltransferase TrmD [Bacillota bacterium]